MKIISDVKNLISDCRNMSSSETYLVQAGAPNWSQWTVNKAVAEGFKKSGWVYRAVSLIARNGASVPWSVFNAEGERQDGHKISKLLANPNPHFSRQDLFELLIAWYQLAGWGYLKRVRSGGVTKELWPISPDRLSPIPSRDPERLVDGYAKMGQHGSRENKADPAYPVEDVVHFKMLDPADPLQGIGPLQAAARAVDIDNSQQDWNKSAMENRGVVDLLISFKQDLDEAQSKSLIKRISDKIAGKDNARKPLVLGSQATAQKLGLTPAEMDWIQSRINNREEIFMIFGIPPQYGGSFATYNNFLTARRVLWEDTILPLLDDIKDTLNWAFSDELQDGYRISYDTSQVDALREGEDEKAKTAKTYWEMGVPVEQVNRKLGLGLEAFDKWDQPWTGKAAPRTAGEQAQNAGEGPAESRHWQLIPLERRDLEAEQKRLDDLVDGPVLDLFEKLLSEQRRKVFQAIEDQGRPQDAIKDTSDDWAKAIRQTSWDIAAEFAGTVAVGERGRRPLAAMETRDEYEDEIVAQLEEYLDQEGWMLEELSRIEKYTVSLILEQLSDGITQGKTVAEIQQAIEDVGAFSSERALRLSRTLAGTAASIGQISGATVAGAEKKEWVTSGFEVREIHTARDGEKVLIDGRFSDQGYGAPRFPLDPHLEPADRVHCRCSMVFE